MAKQPRVDFTETWQRALCTNCGRFPNHDNGWRVVKDQPSSERPGVSSMLVEFTCPRGHRWTTAFEYERATKEAADA